MSWLWLGALALFPVLDSIYRLVLLSCSRLWGRRARSGGEPPGYLVLVPARAEGEAVEPTLRSLVEAADNVDLRVVLLLDGPDATAAEVASRCGAESVVKEPAGPSKGAVLGWAGEHLREDIERAGALFVLDVGSTVCPGFFDMLGWAPGADGVQAFLSGTGQGPGRTAALSEQIAQRHEDCGREVLGWGVRVRGTGFALKPAAFAAIAGRLLTQVEDTEMSLLLAANGARLVMGPRGALVFDEKPDRVADAARQRARWLAGQLSLPLRHPRTLAKVLLRRPLEGLGFVAEVAGRPLSLTVPFRLLIAAVAWYHSRGPGLVSPVGVVAMVAAGSAAFDVLLNALSADFRLRSAVALIFSWMRAVVLLPRAFFSWMVARRS